jgi:hypothetical protein
MKRGGGRGAVAEKKFWNGPLCNSYNLWCSHTRHKGVLLCEMDGRRIGYNGVLEKDELTERTPLHQCAALLSLPKRHLVNGIRDIQSSISETNFCSLPNLHVFEKN